MIETYSTTGALEAAYKQATGKFVSLSEQQLVDCAGAFNNFGCNGGLPSQAFEYIKYNCGLDTEEAYPYTAKDGVCKYDVNSVGAQVSDSVGDEEELNQAMALVRPVSVAFQDIQDLQFYKGGDHFMHGFGNYGFIMLFVNNGWGSHFFFS